MSRTSFEEESVRLSATHRGFSVAIKQLTGLPPTPWCFERTQRRRLKAERGGTSVPKSHRCGDKNCLQTDFPLGDGDLLALPHPVFQEVWGT